MNRRAERLAYRFLFALVALVVVGVVTPKVNTYPVWKGTLRAHDPFCCVYSDSEDYLSEQEIIGEQKTLYCPNERKGMVREVSAYNSVPDQADSSPCTSADGTDICSRHRMGECIVAANAYPLKTRLRIDKVGDCTVADRTHARYADRVDLFMDKDVQGAIRFGVQKLVVIEIEEEM